MRTSIIPPKQALSSIRAVLRRGGTGILPTDTIYGIVGSALNKKTVARIYRLRKRNPKKPLIVLIGSLRDIARFGVKLSARERKLLNRMWPGQVSVIFNLNTPGIAKKFSYLHRGTNTIAFRMPAPAWLCALLHATGPLVAPSANWEGEPPAKNIKEAKKYFGDGVDFYIDIGRLVAKPSTIIRIENGELRIVRQGAAKVPKY